ncbi:MAG: hypothetical protein AAF790_08440 [Planctomycetota bacterium]
MPQHPAPLPAARRPVACVLPMRRDAGLVWLAAVAVAMAALAIATPPACGSDAIDAKLSRRGSIVKRWVARPTSSQSEVKLFNDYFDRYYFPAMTQADPIEMGKIASLRANLTRQYLKPATPDVQQQLTKKAFDFASRVIRSRGPDGQPKRYAREVKYNAVLLLGDLGKSYPRDGADPLPEANSFLCRVAELAASKRLASYMQAGALVSLAQQAEHLDKLPSANQLKTVNALRVATTQEAVSGAADKATRDWLRGRAASGLAAAAKKTGSKELVAALIKLVSDDSLTLDTRVQIAASLQGLPLPGEGGLAPAVLDLAAEIAKAEAEEARDFEDKQIEGTRASLDLIDSQRYRYDTVSSRLLLIREGLAARLATLRDALAAAGPVAGEMANDLRAAEVAVDAALRQAVSEDTIDLDVTAEIKRMAAALTRAAPPEEPKPAAEAEPDDAGVPAADADLF